MMKKLLFSLLFISGVGFTMAQTYPYHDIKDIVFNDSTDLANCTDTSSLLGDTIVTRFIVTTDGDLGEVRSSRVRLAHRPFIGVVDTGYGGTVDGFEAAVVMGTYLVPGQSDEEPSIDIQNALAGDSVEMTAVVGVFGGLIQLTPINATAVTNLGSTDVPPVRVIDVSDIQDENRQNVLPTGEQWEGAYVEIQNVVVTSTSSFSGGTRAEFTVRDAEGNQVLVADRFLAMKVDGELPVNPNSPQASGTFKMPLVGTTYKYIRGVIFQDENGCQGGGGFAGGYEINPVVSADFLIDSFPAPTITNVNRMPAVPSDTDTVIVSAEVYDIDGVLDTVILYYSPDTNATKAQFIGIPMVDMGGDIFEAVIPAFGGDTIVRYFIEATDDSAKVSTAPVSSPNEFRTFSYEISSEPLTIMDIQRVSDLSMDDSPLEGFNVTVSGFVTASLQTDDLEWLYIQDSSSNMFSGIYITGGGLNALSFERGDPVTVEGTVEEESGVTRINADTSYLTPGMSSYLIPPVVLDPSDANYFGSNTDSLEIYEGMYLRYENPMGSVWVTDVQNFGEYLVGSGQNATTSARVLAGRYEEGRNQGSLNVSYLSDTAAYGPNLNPGIAPIEVDSTYRMDYLDGILFYGFGSYKLTPRNNDDFSMVLVSVESISAKGNVNTTIFPNPTENLINISIENTYQFDQLNIQLIDLTGRVITERRTSVHLNEMNLEGFDRGVYFLRIIDGQENIATSKIILK